MNKIVIGLIVLALVGAGGYYYIYMMKGQSSYQLTPSPTSNLTNQNQQPSPSITSVPDQTATLASPISDTILGRSITLDSFMFGYSLPEITVKAGETLTIKLTNSGGTHDWVIDELGVRTKQIKKGETDQVTFTVPASATGQTFTYYCSVANHRQLGMEGKLVVK